MGSMFSLFYECIGGENDSSDSNESLPLLYQNSLNVCNDNINKIQETMNLQYESFKDLFRKDLEKEKEISKKRDKILKNRVSYLEKRMDALGNAFNGSILQDIDLSSEL